MGLNSSKTCENALKLAIDRLKPIYESHKPKIDLITHKKLNLVGPPGFEPESRESKSQSLDQASRRPLLDHLDPQLQQSGQLILDTNLL